LSYVARPDRTLVHRRHTGPLLVQRPFYPEPDGTCHSYVLHPPGGVAGGDSLELSVTVAAGARCLLTAPGATRFYRAPDAVGRQRVEIRVAAGAVCEYLPMETILFDGANARTETEVHLAGDATFVGWEIVSLGRPAAGERFTTGSFRQRSTIRRDGRPIWFERLALAGGGAGLDAAEGLGGQAVFGTLVYAGPLPGEAVETLRATLAPAATGTAAISQLRDVVVCRYAGPKVASAREFFAEAWAGLRRLGQGKPAVAPRIWAT
jgi:urease accessory protein